MERVLPKKSLFFSFFTHVLDKSSSAHIILRASGFGLRASGFGLRASGFGL
ncbi:MAG: hypothetical protein SPL22_02595 [Treponema sp.]|uniref:hypothetical protein n=1 Tax=Treponema sp. TaxID=166 RepID=UPI002A919492|nr:hypothetical protein [Treponema sp.]MDY6396594.1 hypothetical protein [Treponema sp.]